MIKKLAKKFSARVTKFRQDIQKYKCHNGNSCSYKYSHDDWHCDGCKHKELYNNSPPIQTMPHFGSSVNINSNGDELLIIGPDKKVTEYVKNDLLWKKK